MRRGTALSRNRGAGFIGGHLSAALVSMGHNVVALDNLSTGRLSNLKPLEGDERFQFVQGSVTDELIVDDLVRGADIIVHLAAAVGVALIHMTNIRGSEVLLAAAHRYRRKVLVASTSEIYGKNSAGPLHE